MAASLKRLVAMPSMHNTYRVRARHIPPISTNINYDVAPSIAQNPDTSVLPNDNGAQLHNVETALPVIPPPILEVSRPSTPSSGSAPSVPSILSSPDVPRCMVCFEPKELTEIGASNCSHDSRVCEECLERHIEISVCDRGFTNITCPSLSCNEALSYEDVLAGIKDESILSR
jgi:hypothetical protein